MRNIVSPLEGIRSPFGPRFGTAFSPASLFAAGEQGVWYDPSDFSTMFQDVAGTTPVTAVEQPVRLLLDKSKGLALGPELITNGNFSSATGWTQGAGWSISSGVATATATSGYLGQTVASVVAGKYYDCTVTITSYSSGTLRFFAGAAAALSTAMTAAGTYNLRVCANSSSQLGVVGTSFTGVIDNISFKEVTGNHASQSTNGAQPVLSARVNQLLATATLATQSVTTLAATYTLSFSGAGTVTTTGTNIGVYSAGTHSITCTAGTLTLTVVGSVTTADLRVANDGVGIPAYQRVNTSTDYDTTGFPYYLRFDGTDDSMATSTITPGIDKVQVFSGVRKLSDAAFSVVFGHGPNTNFIAGSFEVLSTGWNVMPSRYGAAVNITGVSRSDTPASFAPPRTDVLAWRFDMAGATVVDEIRLRVNASEQTLTNTDPAQSGNFTAQIGYIGSRGGSSLRFNGRIYSLIVRFGANLDATTITNTETWVNGKTYAYA